MIAGTIWNQLITTLEGNNNLSRYIKKVFEGQRFEIEPDSLPCIMLELTANNSEEPGRNFNQQRKIYLDINIFAFSSNDYSKQERTIVGDQNYTGILQIENDIRACLQSSYSLGETCINIDLQPTVFDQGETSKKYPVRGLSMPIRILYRQTEGQ